MLATGICRTQAAMRMFAEKSISSLRRQALKMSNDSGHNSCFHPVTHVIFDMDGLLLNTEDHYTIAHNMFLKRFGHTFGWDLKIRQMGRGQREGYQLVIDHFQLPVSVDDMITEMTTYLEQLFPKAQLMPGAERLVRHLYNNGVPIALCSGSKAHFYRMKTANYQDLFGLFRHALFTPDDPEVKRGKPHPDCFQICANRFHPDKPKSAAYVLVFEDSINGVEAALNAGMQVVLVPDKRMEQAMRKRATLCIDSLLNFEPEAFQLPPFPDKLPK